MIGFISAAGGMLLGSLGFVLPPLLRTATADKSGATARDEAAPAKPAGSEGEEPQRWPAVAAALFVPLTAVTLYAALGNPNGLQPAPEAARTAEIGPAQIEQMVSRLAARLARQPGDANGWRMLARSYETQRRFSQAADAYRHLQALEPDNPDVLVDYAVVLGMTLNGSLLGEPEALLAKALALNPNHIQALALSGSAALERGDADSAVKPWKKILALVPADSDIGRSIADNITKAQQQK